MYYLVIIVLLIIAYIQIPGLIKSRQWGDTIIVISLLLISLVYDVALINDWQLPHLQQGVAALFGPVTIYLESFL